MLKLSNKFNVTTIIDDTSLFLRNAPERIKRILCAKDSENWNKKLVESDKLRTSQLWAKNSIAFYRCLETTVHTTGKK